jgi:CheY-like chemotaxis protein
MTSLSGPVLLVEDDVDIRETLKAYLEMQGHRVHAVGNGREAMSALTVEPRPALVLLDMGLPVMDGHKVLSARKASEVLREVPVVVVSAGAAGMSARDLALYASTFNVAAVLKKPVDPQQVLDAVERHGLKGPQMHVAAPA